MFLFILSQQLIFKTRFQLLRPKSSEPEAKGFHHTWWCVWFQFSQTELTMVHCWTLLSRSCGALYLVSFSIEVWKRKRLEQRVISSNPYLSSFIPRQWNAQNKAIEWTKRICHFRSYYHDLILEGYFLYFFLLRWGKRSPHRGGRRKRLIWYFYWNEWTIDIWVTYSDVKRLSSFWKSVYYA